jgi:hypothetical protein
MTLFKERIRAPDHAKDKDKLKWFMVEIELFGLAHLKGDENNHFIPALFHEGLWYFYAAEDNGVRIRLDPEGVLSMLFNPAGLDFFLEESIRAFIPDEPLPPGDSSEPVRAK